MGVLGTTQASLPLLMAAKGTVANSGLIRTIMMQPYHGVYAASKVAVEMLSEQMRLEFAPIEVKVLVVNVGAVKTLVFNNNPSYRDIALPANSLYKPIEAMIGRYAKGERVPAGAMKPEDVAKKVVGDLEAGRTGEVNRGSFASILKVLTAILPHFVLDIIALNGSGLDRLAKTYEDSAKDKHA